MAALKPLLDAECGTTNPLIKLSQFYSRDNTLVTQDGLIKPTTSNYPVNANLTGGGNATIDELVNEYHRPIAAPNTFHLEGLLTGLRLADDNNIDSTTKQDFEWTSQFLDTFTNDFTTNTPKSNSHFLSSFIHPDAQPNQWMPWNEQSYIPPAASFPMHSTSNYFDQQSSTTATTVDAAFDNDTVKAAQNILSLLQESQFAADTEFKSFVELVAGEQTETSLVDAKKQQATSETKDETAEKWIDEFSSETSWQTDWSPDAAHISSLDDQIPRSQSWLRHLMDHGDRYSEYQCAKINRYIDHPKPYEEGLQRLREHDIVNAILLFESAVQKQSNHADAWLYLGITQSENEQDAPAICALKKCVEIDPKKLQAYITLASSYANEMLTNEALDSLRQWLLNNDKYSHLLANRRSQTTNNNEPRLIDELLFEELQELFLQAVSLAANPTEIDADLQVCLGVLFHLPGDYDKAAECFSTAVSARPNDALLWNKLGAALANGGQSEKAIDAYYHALSLSPGFVRARYNLGISCFNLSAYKQAIEHFLLALKQQNDGMGPQGSHVQMSDNIWRTLAIAIGHLQRPDLESSIATKDLTKLLNEFHIE